MGNDVAGILTEKLQGYSGMDFVARLTVINLYVVKSAITICSSALVLVSVEN